MSDADDIDLLAAEYVLGTLDAAERAGVATRMGIDPQLARAVEVWQERISPLSEAAVAVAPPADAYQRLAERLFGGPAEWGTVGRDGAHFERRVRIWQGTAAGFAALAASLAVWIAVAPRPAPSPELRYSTVLQQDPANPAMVLELDPVDRRLTVHPLTATAPAGRSFELWIIDPKLGAPQSLGVVPPRAVRNAVLDGFEAGVMTGATYAVTIEPPGGSPNGKPSGAPVLSGKLTPAL